MNINCATGNSVIIGNNNGVIVNGKRYEGSNIVINGSHVKVDGKEVDIDPDAKEINIAITGNVERIENMTAPLTVNGDVAGNISDVSGNITVTGSVHDISDVSGNINIRGNVSSISDISGNIGRF